MSWNLKKAAVTNLLLFLCCQIITKICPNTNNETIYSCTFVFESAVTLFDLVMKACLTTRVSGFCVVMEIGCINWKHA